MDTDQLSATSEKLCHQSCVSAPLWEGELLWKISKANRARVRVTELPSHQQTAVRIPQKVLREDHCVELITQLTEKIW